MPMGPGPLSTMFAMVLRTAIDPGLYLTYPLQIQSFRKRRVYMTDFSREISGERKLTLCLPLQSQYTRLISR